MESSILITSRLEFTQLGNSLEVIYIKTNFYSTSSYLESMIPPRKKGTCFRTLQRQQDSHIPYIQKSMATSRKYFSSSSYGSLAYYQLHRTSIYLAEQGGIIYRRSEIDGQETYKTNQYSCSAIVIMIQIHRICNIPMRLWSH